MIQYKKYIATFVVQFILFVGILCLFDWKSLTLHKFYTNLIGGLFFGSFMTFYSYWEDKRKNKKDEGKTD